MTRKEFLQQLRQALENDLSGTIVQENVDYYSQYITEEIRKGRQEEDVLQMLGDPWILAKTVIDAQDGTDRSTVHHKGGAFGGHEEENRVKKENKRRPSPFGLDKWWRKLLLVIGIILVIAIVFSAIAGIISLLVRFLVPALIIIIIIRIVGGRRS